MEEEYTETDLEVINSDSAISYGSNGYEDWVTIYLGTHKILLSYGMVDHIKKYFDKMRERYS